jgi:hypothetical protein
MNYQFHLLRYLIQSCLIGIYIFFISLFPGFYILGSKSFSFITVSKIISPALFWSSLIGSGYVISSYIKTICITKLLYKLPSLVYIVSSYIINNSNHYRRIYFFLNFSFMLFCIVKLHAHVYALLMVLNLFISLKKNKIDTITKIWLLICLHHQTGIILYGVIHGFQSSTYYNNILPYIVAEKILWVGLYYFSQIILSHINKISFDVAKNIIYKSTTHSNQDGYAK